MPVTTRRSAASSNNQRSTTNATPTASTTPSSPNLLTSKLRNRLRAGHPTQASPSPAETADSSTSPSPESARTTPAPAPAVDKAEQANPMLGREQSTLRGRNVEDIHELEEKGLLKHGDVSRSATASPDRWDSKSKGKAKETRLEKITLDDEGSVGLSSKRDREAFALLVVLYLLQGIPLGLTFGTLPFLLKPHLSYSQLAVFALATWPYSLKLLWSPIVDACFLPKWGRRKSWIVPVQAIVGVGLWIIGGQVENWLSADQINIKLITIVFGSLILAAATQDIAVDGWALTLLSPQNLSYASTAQTIGLGIGNALAFTVFLAFNSKDFSNKYFRSIPLDYGLVSLGGYMKFWAMMFLVVTVWLAFRKTEDPVSEDDPDMDVRKVYKVMWSIVQLKNIREFLIVHLICKIGFQVNDSVTSLKLLEKGLSKEDMAVAVLLDFPAQMIVGWLAAKWSRPKPSKGHALSGKAGGGEVLRPWIMAFWARLGMAMIATLVVWAFPTGKVGTGYFGLVVATTLMSSLTSTVQFVGITAFHTQIADPLIGGTYMTLLNTLSNLGGTWPKPLILRGVDILTTATCHVPLNHLGQKSTGSLGECVSEHGKQMCAKRLGECVVERDGYYVMSVFCVVLGGLLLVGYILPTVRRLQSLPMKAWRVRIPH